MKRLVTILFFLLFVVVAVPTWADYLQGLRAYHKRDFAGALQAWENSASFGDPRSQYGIGVLYRHGEGVKQDGVMAAKWFLKAARQDLAEAQYELGVMRAIGGVGVTQDAVQAYVWFALAARNGEPQAGDRRDLVASMLKREEMTEARKRIAAWRAGNR